MSNMPRTNPVPSVFSAQAVSVTVAVTPVVYLAVLFALRMVLPPEQRGSFRAAAEYAKELMAGFFLAGIMASLAALKIRSLLATRGNGGLQAKMQAVIVFMAIAETGGVLGVVLFFLTGRWTKLQ